MSEIPNFLHPDVAGTFENQDVAASYRYRPSYPPQTFKTLAGLISDESPAVLDLGCGTGFVARPLAPLADRVDAIDVSAAMIHEGMRLPGGDHPHLTWIVGRVESAPLHPPYSLMTAGDSLHWMDWDVVLPRLAGALSQRGVLAILTAAATVVADGQELHHGTLKLIQRYSTFTEWRPDFDLVTELQGRGLFREQGRFETEATPFRQPVDEYVESFHARASLSWERMDPDAAAAFDSALQQLVVKHVGEVVELAVQGTIVWGKPLHT